MNNLDQLFVVVSINAEVCQMKCIPQRVLEGKSRNQTKIFAFVGQHTSMLYTAV